MVAREAEAILPALDESGDGNLDFIEFLCLMVSKNLEIQRVVRTQIVSMREAFNLFDEDGDGEVSAEDFCEALRMLGMKATIEQANAMVEAVDDDGPGTIDLCTSLQAHH